jgi:hypothetical protein
MASGDAVVQIIKEMPPGSDYATLDAREGGSTPKEEVLVHDFDAAADEYIDFLCKLEGYGGGGLTFTLVWSASSATANEVRWGIAIRRIADDAEDIDGAHSYDFNEVDDTAPNVSGEVSHATITFSNGADMDSWAEGELAIVRVYRNADHANDDLTGDAELWGVFGLET